MRGSEVREMQCTTIRRWLFRFLDDELTESERELLASHLATCSSCAREWKILSMPRRIGNAFPVLKPSSRFYRDLRTRLANEDQSIGLWQILLALSRQVVPALAVLTLILVSLFAYLQLRQTEIDIYQAYEGIFLPGDLTERMAIEDQEDLTDEALLRVLAGSAESPPDRDE